MYRNYTITEERTGKTREIECSPLFAFDVTRKYYRDILKGEYYGPNTIRFYSLSKGFITTCWED